jgi:hypothetical protein
MLLFFQKNFPMFTGRGKSGTEAGKAAPLLAFRFFFPPTPVKQVISQSKSLL